MLAVEIRPMSSQVLTCPYCNSTVAAPPLTRPGQRVPCPRCGESFPLRDSAAAEPVTPVPEPPADSPPAASPRLSNGRLALLILGGMIAMALIGLAYALHTQDLRRSYDIQLPKTRSIDVPLIARIALGLYVTGLIAATVWGWNRRERAAGAPRPWTRRLGVPGLAVVALVAVGLALIAIQARPVRPPLELDRPRSAPVPPAELAALGYLPDDIDAIAAVHVAEVLDEPTGRDVLRRIGLGGEGAPDLEKWTGLKLDDLDHVVVGLKLDAEMLTRFVIVARARHPIDPRNVCDALKTTAKQEVDGRTVYPFVLQTGLPLLASVGVSLWFADEETLVIAKKFENLPQTPRKGIDHLRPALREAIREHLAPASHVWVAAHAESWDGLNFLLRQGLNEALGRDAENFNKVRTVALALTIENGLTLIGSAHCQDEPAAAALRKYLDPANRKGFKTLFDPQDAGPLGQAFLDSLRVTQQERWVTVDAAASAAAVRRTKR